LRDFWALLLLKVLRAVEPQQYCRAIRNHFSPSLLNWLHGERQDEAERHQEVLEEEEEQGFKFVWD
jgi:hypothetical protein